MDEKYIYDFSTDDESETEETDNDVDQTTDDNVDDDDGKLTGVKVKLTKEEEQDEEYIRKSYDNGCSCKSRNCMVQYNVFKYAVFSCRELTREQLDMCLLGIIQNQAEDYDKVRYSFRGISVCKSAFCKLY